MDKNRELSTALRKAVRQGGYDGSDALSWRELLEGAADEIDRLRGLGERNEHALAEGSEPRRHCCVVGSDDGLRPVQIVEAR